jgi:photosystem II stability/assembly factor-like uncharacterized protein
MKYALVICVQICFFTYCDQLYSQNIIWEQTSGPTGGNIRKLVVNSSDYLFAINRLSGIFRSTDNGANWTAVNTGITNLDVRSLVVNVNGDLFAGSVGGVFRSSDDGATWTPANSGLPYTANDLAVNASGHLFAAIGPQQGYGGVFRSTNNGDSWTIIGLKDTAIRNIAVQPASGHIFVVTELGEGVFRSTNNGATWVAIKSGLPENCATANFPIVSRSNGVLFVVFDCEPGMYRSNNNGDTWAYIRMEGIFAYVHSLAFNSNGHLFAGTSGLGVFRSTDNGSHWTSTGLTGKFVTSLAVNSVGILFAGTNADGVFRSSQTTVHVKQTENRLPSAFALEQNYPNPFNPATTISFTLAQPSFVRLIVYDLLGRKISTLLHEKRDRGRHQIVWEAKDLASGIYVIHLETPAGYATRKVTLLK